MSKLIGTGLILAAGAHAGDVSIGDRLANAYGKYDQAKSMVRQYRKDTPKARGSYSSGGSTIAAGYKLDKVIGRATHNAYAAKENAYAAADAAYDAAHEIKDDVTHYVYDDQETQHEETGYAGKGNHVIQFMHAADSYGAQTYWKFRGSYHANEKTKSKDKNINGGSDSTTLETKSIITTNVTAGTDSTQKDYTTNYGDFHDYAGQYANDASSSISGNIGGGMVSSSSNLTIATADPVTPPTCVNQDTYSECKWISKCMWKNSKCQLRYYYGIQFPAAKWAEEWAESMAAGSSGCDTACQHARRQRRERLQRRRLHASYPHYHYPEEEPKITIEEDETSMAGQIGGDLTTGYSSGASGANSGDYGQYHTVSGPNTQENEGTYSDDTYQFQKHTAEGHDGDYSLDKDVHKAKQNLDLNYLVEGVDPHLGMQMLDEFSGLLEKGSSSYSSPSNYAKSNSITINKSYADSAKYTGDDGYVQIADATAVAQDGSIAQAINKNSAQVNYSMIEQNIDSHDHKTQEDAFEAALKSHEDKYHY